MQKYLSTFISGFQKPIQELLKEKIKDVKINSVLDGAIIYQTNLSAEKIKLLRFFNNSFVVIKEFPNLKRQNSFGFMMSSIAKLENLEKIIFPFLKNNNRSFRIMVSDENRFVSPDINLLKKIEKRISSIKNYRLRLNINNPDTEFWFLKRSEYTGFFLFRIIKNKFNKKLERGELRPELSHILCYLSQPNKSDIFLDPFSGSGSIPIERVQSFPSKKIFATDKIENYSDYINKRILQKQIKERIISKTSNATNLDFLEDNSISKIVTDPPWGDYEKIENIIGFYEKVLKEFERVLKENGILIFLTSKKDEFEEVIKEFKKFTIKQKYDILLSGKKVRVYKIIKN